MKKLLTLLCLVLLLGPFAQAQQRPVFSQYMFNGLAINPAYAGSQKQFYATALMRNQWVNLEGAPKTQTLSAHTSLDKKNIGLGLQVYREEIGVHTDMGIYASYAYQIKFKGGAKLALGLQAGFNNLLSHYDELDAKHLDDPMLQYIRNFNPNFGTGAYYSTRNFYAGLSVPYLINNKLNNAIQESLTNDGREARYYFFHTGRVFDLHPDIKVKPSMLVRMQEGAPLGADFNVNFFLQNIINVGGSWRTGDSVIFLFELNLNENFSFGYSYDMVTSSLNNYTRGSHELMFNYKIRLSPEPCHSYF